MMISFVILGIGSNLCSPVQLFVKKQANLVFDS